MPSTSETIWIFDPNRPWKQQTPEALPPLDDPAVRFLVNSWSPDGTRLVAQLAREDSGRSAGIATWSLGSHSYETLTDFGEWPVWLPDSRRVLFVADGRAFHIVDSRTKQVQKIFSVTSDVVGPPRITRDGRTAYFSRRVTESDIWLVTLK